MRTHISSGSTFERDLAYARAVVADGWVFVSGTTGYDYQIMHLPDGVEAQCEQAFLNIDAALRQAGSGLADIVRVRYLLADADEFPRCWPILRRFLGEVRPAATMHEARLMEQEMRIEIEVTARLQSPVATL